MAMDSEIKALSGGKASSPCTGLCRVNHQTALCIGCGRSLLEITEWSNKSDAERKAIKELARLRLRPN